MHCHQCVRQHNVLFYDRCKMAVNYNFEMENNEKWIKLKGCVA